jgi:tetratricopeptide (TPR) repeat protein
MTKIISGYKLKRELQKALDYCQKGSLNEAKEIYTELIKTLPDHPEILSNLGVIEIQFRNFEDGISYLKRSLEIDSSQAFVYSNLGNALLELNQAEEAIFFYEKAIKLYSKNSEFYYNKGRALKSINYLDAAIEAYTKAIEIDFNHFNALNNRGVVYNLKCEYQCAIKDFDSAIKVKSDFFEAYLNKGISLISQKKYQEAILNIDTALIINPNIPEAHSKKGIALNKLEEYEAAIHAFDQAILLKSDFVEPYNEKAISLYKLNNLEEALENLNKSLQINPENYNSLLTKGAILYDQKKYEYSLEVLLLAKKLNPKKSEAIINIAQIYIETGKDNLALEEFNSALAMDNDYPISSYNAALFFLQKMNFKRGWQLYEKRIYIEKYKKDNQIFDGLESKRLSTINCENKIILIKNEQGLGDQILYMSLIPELKRNNKVIVMVDKRLISLLQRSFPNIEFISNSSGIGNIVYDYYVLAASLGKFFRGSIEAFKNQPIRYLKAEKELTKKIKEKFVKNNKLICGIAWKSQNEQVGPEKSIKLIDYLPILKIKEIDFIDLQYGDTQEERNDIFHKYNILINHLDDIDIYNDIDGLASLINACDFIVTTSNVTAHLAGALGKDVYLILPSGRGKIWYWHDSLTKSIWYPSVNQFDISKEKNKEQIINEIANEIKGVYLC